MVPPIASSSGFGQNELQDEPARRAQRFQNADLARALQHRHIHGEADHAEADHQADADDHVDELATPPTFSGVSCETNSSIV